MAGTLGEVELGCLGKSGVGVWYGRGERRLSPRSSLVRAKHHRLENTSLLAGHPGSLVMAQPAAPTGAACRQRSVGDATVWEMPAWVRFPGDALGVELSSWARGQEAGYF